MDIEDLQDDWDDEMNDINDKLYEKAVEVGISKDEYFHKYKFDIFDIKDMQYEKKHSNIGHVHKEGKKCEICTGKAKKEENPMVAKREKQNPGILANTRTFGNKGVRYDTTHLLNYKGVAQTNGNTREKDWKNSMYNQYYKA